MDEMEETNTGNSSLSGDDDDKGEASGRRRN